MMTEKFIINHTFAIPQLDFKNGKRLHLDKVEYLQFVSLNNNHFTWVDNKNMASVFATYIECVNFINRLSPVEEIFQIEKIFVTE